MSLSGVIKRVLTDDLESAGHLTTHGLRKNAGIALAEAGCTVPEIQAILGHRTPQMALYYANEANKRTLSGRGMTASANGRGRRNACSGWKRPSAKPLNGRGPNLAKPL